MDLDTQAVPHPPNPLIVKATLSLWFDRREESPPEEREREEESELKETAKLKGLRRGEVRRGVRHAEDKFFRTITRHLELCLPVTRSRKRKKKEGNTNREREK